jgi:hypothetical protein
VYSTLVWTLKTNWRWDTVLQKLKEECHLNKQV